MKRPHGATPRKKSLQRKRMAAKVGMTASLGVLLYTAMRRGRRAMVPHTWAGLGLMGLTIWHWALYQPGAGRTKSRAALPPPTDAPHG